jgi:hypothetical protein
MMITATQLKMLSTRTATELTHMIQDSGYKIDSFTGADFVGMTNGHQFCYKVAYPFEDGHATAKVFITFDPTTGKAIADY